MEMEDKELPTSSRSSEQENLRKTSKTQTNKKQQNKGIGSSTSIKSTEDKSLPEETYKNPTSEDNEEIKDETSIIEEETASTPVESTGKRVGKRKMKKESAIFETQTSKKQQKEKLGSSISMKFMEGKSSPEKTFKNPTLENNEESKNKSSTIEEETPPTSVESTGMPDRLEDVFQDEIIRTIVKIADFKSFARSKRGLCLDESDITTILEDNSESVQEQKIGLLEKWREINSGEATVRRIRSVLEGYLKGKNPNDTITVGNGMFEIFLKEKLSERSDVYLGRQMSELDNCSRFCAIKFMRHDDANFREARISAKLRKHVNVTSIIHADACYFGHIKYIFIAMELSSTATLQDILYRFRESDRKLDHSQKINIASQLIDGLAFIHKNDILHRDVKPENILIFEDLKHIEITDFGISKAMRDRLQTRLSNASTGTIGYRAPETYNIKNKIGRPSDVYSTGVTMGQLFSDGRHPFGDDEHLWSHNIINNKNLDLSHLNISNKLLIENLLYKMLDPNPVNRPTAVEVSLELKRLGDHQTPDDAIEVTEGFSNQPDYKKVKISSANDNKIPDKVTHGKGQDSAQVTAAGTSMQTDSIDADKSCVIEKVTYLKGHTKLIHGVAWNPVCELLATGSKDKTARIWNLQVGDGTSSSASSYEHSILHHSSEVLSLDWNNDGTFLATGTSRGISTWTMKGQLVKTFESIKNSDYVDKVRWNKSGTHLITGGSGLHVWGALSGNLVQDFAIKKHDFQDFDWQSNTRFASCFKFDKSIYVYEVDHKKPVKTFHGHTRALSSIEWNPSGNLLASGSDDATVKIWSMQKNSYEHSLNDHHEDILKVTWSPSGPGSRNPNQDLLLASASSDNTVRIWNPEQGICLNILEDTKQTLRCIPLQGMGASHIAFSPDGKLLAGKPMQKNVYFWNVHDGRLVQSYNTKEMSGITCVSWNATGTRVAVGGFDGGVEIFDLRK